MYLLEDIMPNKIIETIRTSERSIYDAADDDLLIPTDQLEALLSPTFHVRLDGELFSRRNAA